MQLAENIVPVVSSFILGDVLAREGGGGGGGGGGLGETLKANLILQRVEYC